MVDDARDLAKDLEHLKQKTSYNYDKGYASSEWSPIEAYHYALTLAYDAVPRAVKAEAALTALESGDQALRIRFLEKRTATLEKEIEHLREARKRADVLENAIKKHRAQVADDRCQFDDDELYAALGDGVKCDRRVGDKQEMLRNCGRFIENRCEEGGPWPSYAELLMANALLCRALAPFAVFWGAHPWKAMTHFGIGCGPSDGPDVPTLGDCKKAAEALASAELPRFEALEAGRYREALRIVRSKISEFAEEATDPSAFNDLVESIDQIDGQQETA
jgi:hypothetical protein